MTIKNDKFQNEEYMSEKMTSMFSEKLKNEATNLRATIEENDKIAKQKNSEADPIDQASVESERELGLVNRDRDIARLKKTSIALNKIKTGDYGYCDACGIEIGVPRLSINPALPHCVDCADIAEKKSKHYMKG